MLLLLLKFDRCSHELFLFPPLPDINRLLASFKILRTHPLFFLYLLYKIIKMLQEFSLTIFISILRPILFASLGNRRPPLPILFLYPLFKIIKIFPYIIFPSTLFIFSIQNLCKYCPFK